MSDNPTGRVSTDVKGQTDWDQLDRMTDEEIDRSEIPALDADFWTHAQVVKPGERSVRRPRRARRFRT